MARFCQSLFAVQFLVCCFASALPAQRLESRQSDDAFYQPPAGYESTAPGTILRSRQITAALFGLIPDPVEAYQLLYTSTATNGTLIADVTTVFKPVNAQTDRFVSFQTAYDSSGATACNPSQTYALGDKQSDDVVEAEFIILQAYLLLGYIVASPDYEGPDVAFAPSHLEGMGVLDNIRAVSNFHETLGLSTSTPAVVAIGYSGGAIATGWAASLHSSYAPELPMKGWVTGGTPSNLTTTLLYLDNTINSGYIPAALDGLLKPSAYQATLQPVVNRVITPYGQSKLDLADGNCVSADSSNFQNMSILSTDFQTKGMAILYEPAVQAILLNSTMGAKKSETPIAPVMMYHASHDEIIPYGSAFTTRTAWCNDGDSVSFSTYAVGGHITTEILGVPSVIEFVGSAFAGTTQSGCPTTDVVDTVLDTLGLGPLLKPVLDELQDILNANGIDD